MRLKLCVSDSKMYSLHACNSRSQNLSQHSHLHDKINSSVTLTVDSAQATVGDSPTRGIRLLSKRNKVNLNILH
jgi:hypothetical protein